jgi:hypothetical protein
MDNLESALVRWFSDRLGPAIPGLSEQLAAARAGEREFSNGGGAFVTLQVATSAATVHRIALNDGATALDGPEIRSPELESGALATLHVDPDGVLRSVEIWCCSNDYPVGRHPNEFILVEADVNYVDMRGEL